MPAREGDYSWTLGNMRDEDYLYRQVFNGSQEYCTAAYASNLTDACSYEWPSDEPCCQSCGPLPSAETGGLTDMCLNSTLRPGSAAEGGAVPEFKV